MRSASSRTPAGWCSSASRRTRCKFRHPLFHKPEGTLLCSRNALSADFSRIIQLIEDGRIDTGPWITHRTGFEDLIDVFPSYTRPRPASSRRLSKSATEPDGAKQGIRKMIRSSVTVSLVPEVRGGPFVFWDDLPGGVPEGAGVGFDAVEVFPPAADAVDVPALRTLLQDHGLALAAVGTGAGWVKGRLHLCLPDAAARAKARAFIRSIIDVAGQLGAPAIIGSMQGRSGDGVDHPTAVGYLCRCARGARRARQTIQRAAHLRAAQPL